MQYPLQFQPPYHMQSPIQQGQPPTRQMKVSKVKIILHQKSDLENHDNNIFWLEDYTFKPNDPLSKHIFKGSKDKNNNYLTSLLSAFQTKAFGRLSFKDKQILIVFKLEGIEPLSVPPTISGIRNKF
jgi:hypothetical protein